MTKYDTSIMDVRRATKDERRTTDTGVRGKKVLVLGIGASGTAAAKLLVREGAVVSCSDLSEADDARRRASRLEAVGCRIELGRHTERFARGAEMVVISPGIDPSLPFVREMALRGVPVLSEIELAYRFCSRPIVAVTGTNGKTTTVALMERVLVRAGRDAVACGNIGRPFSDVVGGGREPEIVVLEVSSFQLDGVSRFKPWIAVVLNVADDHLDRYRGIEDYRKAKAMIFRNQDGGDWAIVNARERAGWERLGALRNQSVLEFSAEGDVDGGACVREGSLVVKWRGEIETVCPRDEVRLTGGHNVENALAVAAAATVCGVGPEAVGEVLRSFSGLPHRMEPVGTWNGVRFINDSKATNPDAVIRALQAVAGPVILIAGGRDKGFDYSVLRGEISKRVKVVVLIGEARGKMRRNLDGAAETCGAESMPEAVRAAAERAAPGDTVLLSPACSSYDMYKSFEERGEEFKKSVVKLMTNDKEQMTKPNGGKRKNQIMGVG
jgi:UDP-N-acetylmuramoylalanine--D-glutamate ligase